MRYALARRENLLRYLDDGCLAIDNNPAERALRGIALGRKNYLFAGSDAGGERAAAIYSLIETARLNGLDPQAYPIGRANVRTPVTNAHTVFRLLLTQKQTYTPYHYYDNII